MKSNFTTDCNPEITKWLDNAGRFPRLSAESVNMIAKQIQSLPETSKKRKRLVNKLVEHNLRLVANFVKRFMDSKSHNRWGSVETLDYLQMGVIGLIRAAEKYDPCRGYTFSTYATFWMRSSVGRYNLKTITPVHVSESAARRLIYYKRNGKSRKHGFSRPKTHEEMRQLAIQVGNAYQCVSLDLEPVQGISLAEMLPANRPDEPITRESIFNALKTAGLSNISIEVLHLSFIERKDIRQIARQLNLDDYRVRKIRAQALEQASKRPELF